jgi:hypothetical protein
MVRAFTRAVGDTHLASGIRLVGLIALIATARLGGRAERLLLVSLTSGYGRKDDALRREC